MSLTAADYNLRILWPLARYVEDRVSATALRGVAHGAGLQPEDFDGKSRWVSAEAFEALLVSMRALVSSDDEFQRACVYRIKEAYGPMRYVLWATSPQAVYGASIKHHHLVSTCAEPRILAQDETSIRVRIKPTVANFSRLNCLVRQAQSSALPTFWGLPSAQCREHACAARGDEACELQYHWYESRRWFPVVLGAIVFALPGLLLLRLGVGTLPTPIAMAAFGALLGYIVEARRAERLNVRTREEVMQALRQLADEESEARRELLEMHRRQKDWTRLVEEEMSTRTAAVTKVVSGVQELQQARASTLLGFSHDLRNPLQIIQMASEYLQRAPGVTADPEALESVSDLNQAVERMQRLLGELVQVTKAQRDFVRLAPQRLEIASVTEALRRRLRALVYGRDLRSTVFATREAPETLDIDPLAFDRITDNLLTNAAKYTDRGSIVVELDGTPGFLVIKVSDTGRGIEPQALERVFLPEGSTIESRRGDSFGVGLSVVVHLLEQIGGRLEVMSKPGSGTTFWVRLPVSPADARSWAPDQPPLRVLPGGAVAEQSTEPGLSRVVRIRRLPA